MGRDIAQNLMRPEAYRLYVTPEVNIGAECYSSEKPGATGGIVAPRSHTVLDNQKIEMRARSQLQNRLTHLKRRVAGTGTHPSIPGPNNRQSHWTIARDAWQRARSPGTSRPGVPINLRPRDSEPRAAGRGRSGPRTQLRGWRRRCTVSGQSNSRPTTAAEAGRS